MIHSHPQVGTSSVVYPAAAFAPMLAMRGVPVAEFNLEATMVTDKMKWVWCSHGDTMIVELYIS